MYSTSLTLYLISFLLISISVSPSLCFRASSSVRMFSFVSSQHLSLSIYFFSLPSSSVVVRCEKPLLVSEGDHQELTIEGWAPVSPPAHSHSHTHTSTLTFKFSLKFSNPRYSLSIRALSVVYCLSNYSWDEIFFWLFLLYEDSSPL